VPVVLNILQTAAAVVLVTLGWRLGVGFASLLFIGGWSVILIGHALLFSFGGIYIPLADTALLSSLAMMAGALWRLRIEGRLRALHEARADAEAELAATQERFLNRFAFELADINSEVHRRLARVELGEATGETLQTAYVRALGSCEELNDYLLGIQHFAALQGERLHRPPLEPVDVDDVVQKVLRQFESRKLEGRVDIQVTSSGRVVALGDATLLAQIVYNLVSNGLKYSPPGGSLHITITGGGSRVVLRVTDQGPGIARAFHERIFEKFYRVKDDYVYKLKGHGLGLYLSRYFAEQIEASIAVDSELGRGATFILTLRGAP
jgi:signal transduction histidine kinase